MKKKKVLIWSSAYAELINNERVGGIGVQLMFWAQVLKKNGWEVFSLYNSNQPEDSVNKNGCRFIKDVPTPGIFLFLYAFISLFLIFKVRPNLVILRGGRNRNLFFIAFWCRIFGIKLVPFFGSDADLRPDKNRMGKVDWLNYHLYVLGLRLCKYFVAQNAVQEHLIQVKLHKKNIIVIPNIWNNLQAQKEYNSNDKVILWVSNLRSLKRPKWVCDIAKYFPNERFVMIGSKVDDITFNGFTEALKAVPNVEYKGEKSFGEADGWFNKAKIFLCTSEFEGFPNTFLQAWSRNVPVLSTVDPSDRIKNHGLGFVCDNPSMFVDKLMQIIKGNSYNELQENIIKYFNTEHSPLVAYHKLMKLLYN